MLPNAAPAPRYEVTKIQSGHAQRHGKTSPSVSVKNMIKKDMTEIMTSPTDRAAIIARGRLPWGERMRCNWARIDAKQSLKYRKMLIDTWPSTSAAADQAR